LGISANGQFGIFSGRYARRHVAGAGIFLGAVAQILCASISLAEESVPLGTLGPHLIRSFKQQQAQVPPSTSPQSTSSPVDFQESQFYGCWRHAGARPIANQWTGYSVVCFRNNRTVYYSYVSPEHGGDDLFEWRFIPNDTLSIDEQSCNILPGTNAEHLFLSRCLYMGAWVRQCAQMNNEGTGCPTRDQ
jgi:hypothetical protein